MNSLVVGLLRGDEGKGKITDYLANKHDVVVRYAGGPNAGHSIYRNNKLFVTHVIPAGIFNKKLCIIGRGCVINIQKLYKEYLDLCNFLIKNDNIFIDPYNEIKSLLKISYGTHVITDEHIKQDINKEDSGKGNGSTKQGISPAYRDKYYREGKRVIDIINENKLNSNEINFLKDIIIDEEKFINENNHLNYLFEGAQGVLLDIDNPYYPNVSSSSIGVGGVISGTGISYKNLLKNFSVIGIVKSYMSSVGIGEFITELNDDNKEYSYLNSGETYIKPGYYIRKVGNEYGATTGRPRKVGWLDIPLIKYSIRTTGVDAICLTRLDTLLEFFKNKYNKIPICVAYKNKETNEIIDIADIYNLNKYEPVYELIETYNDCSINDKNFINFIKFIENKLNVPIKYVSIGQNKDNIIEL